MTKLHDSENLLNTSDASNASNTSNAADPGTDPINSQVKTIILDEPITCGTLVVREVQLCKPNASQLSGVTLMELANLDVGALQKILPRITIPSLRVHELNQLDPADLMTLGGELAFFLAKKAHRQLVLPAA